jgi:hypothetical protein
LVERRRAAVQGRDQALGWPATGVHQSFIAGIVLFDAAIDLAEKCSV